MSGGSTSSPTAKEKKIQFDEIEVKENAFGYMLHPSMCRWKFLHW